MIRKDAKYYSAQFIRVTFYLVSITDTSIDIRRQTLVIKRSLVIARQIKALKLMCTQRADPT